MPRPPANMRNPGRPPSGKRQPLKAEMLVDQKKKKRMNKSMQTAVDKVVGQVLDATNRAKRQ